MSNKKRPLYVQEIIDSVNKHIRQLKIKDQYHPLATWLSDYLIKKDLYRGFSMFVEKTDNQGNKYVALAGKGNDFEFIQYF